MPNRFGVQFKLVWFYYAQRRAGCPRSSPSPLRGKLMWYNKGQAPVANVRVRARTKPLRMTK
ncbi:MAG: hypothetical protein LBQ66_00065 [Planctomycetaceae bacterium]|nr:hypothetical protein [Planctomycetaceae bacterium]